MAYLTEQQREEVEDIFFNFVDTFIEENYEVPESYQMTEEEAYIASIIMEHFEENYKFPTLEESVMDVFTGQDPNTVLFDEIYEALFDESVGSMVAGLRYGIKDYLSRRAKGKAASQASAAKERSGQMQAKAKQAAATARTAAVGTNPIQRAKYAYSVNKSKSLADRADKAKQSYRDAETRRKSKTATAGNVAYKRQALGQKIDTGISNVKNRVKSAVSSGASRIGGALGRAAARFS